MKILIKGNPLRYKRYSPGLDIEKESQLVFVDIDADNATVLARCKDADIILADAISNVDGELISKMDKLKMIHSEGVAFNCIDVAVATQRRIYVCNNKGANSASVAEQAIFLMLGLLRSGITGDAAVREGRQAEMKERCIVEGITDLGDCTVGIIGLGDIGLATAKRLSAFGCRLFYYSLHKKSPQLEENYNITYLPLYELAESVDIVSLHAAVTPQTKGMINDEFISHMKKNACLINTARGELVDNEALRRALIEDRIAGAGLDTVAPEPVTTDNPLLNLPEAYRDKIIFSPHLGGVTAGSFTRMHRTLWENAERIAQGKRPINIVNGL